MRIATHIVADENTMTKWMYVSNNGYDYVAKVEDDVARYIAETHSFPNASGDWWGSTEEEKKKIDTFMSNVITDNYSSERDECNANAILDDIEKEPSSRILWERTM